MSGCAFVALCRNHGQNSRRFAQTERWSGRCPAQDGHGMTVAHYRINELDSANCVVGGYAVMCRSDAAALTMASKGAEDRAGRRRRYGKTHAMCALTS
jgi:hypothetical protein